VAKSSLTAHRGNQVVRYCPSSDKSWSSSLFLLTFVFGIHICAIPFTNKYL